MSAALSRLATTVRSAASISPSRVSPTPSGTGCGPPGPAVTRASTEPCAIVSAGCVLASRSAARTPTLLPAWSSMIRSFGPTTTATGNCEIVGIATPQDDVGRGQLRGQPATRMGAPWPSVTTTPANVVNDRPPTPATGGAASACTGSNTARASVRPPAVPSSTCTV